MIIDFRKQEREIRICFKATGYSNNLDDFIDDLIKDLKVVLEQRKISEKVKITIIIK